MLVVPRGDANACFPKLASGSPDASLDETSVETRGNFRQQPSQHPHQRVGGVRLEWPEQEASLCSAESCPPLHPLRGFRLPTPPPQRRGGGVGRTVGGFGRADG